MSLLLFAPQGTLKNRTRAYERVLASLRDDRPIEEPSKPQRHAERERRFIKTGDLYA